VDSFEHDNECPTFIKAGHFLTISVTVKILKEDPAS